MQWNGSEWIGGTCNGNRNGLDWDILAMDLDIIMERILILLSLWVGSLDLIIRYFFTYTVIFNR